MKFVFRRIFFPVFISVLIFSCSQSDAAKKKAVREKWYEYFLSFTTSPNDTLRLGTKDMFVDFQNHSDYKVDSVAIDFHNYGLLVFWPDDTLHAVNIPPNGRISIPVPLHHFGLHETARIIYLHSKDLEFCFDANFPNTNHADDFYHCPNN